MSNTSQPKEEEEEEEEHYRNDDIININEKDKLLMTMAPSSSTMASSSSSTVWLTSKDPRIVRVSRAFGGKDRHSKVCTVRGLRDRRVRLSIPTAIQLYDLQDKLGLNQPSKVVDWLLNVAKDEIDELPPLPENFINGLNTQSLFIKPNKNTSIENCEGSNCRLPISKFSRIRAKQVANDQTLGVQQNETKQEGIILNDDDHEEQVSSNRANNHAFDMLNNNNNNVMSFVYHHHNWEPNLNNYPYSTSNLESQEMLTDFHHNLNDVSLPSNTLSLSSSSGSQFLVSCPPLPPGATQTYFPSHDSSSSSRENIDPRQVNQFLMLSSSTSSTSSTSSQTLYPNNSLSMSPPSFHFSTNAD